VPELINRAPVLPSPSLVDLWEQETERGDRWSTAEGELSPGLRVGEFVIDGKIAEGGMGMVYAAHHPVIGKKAAIKVLSRRVCDEETTERFIREAKAVNRIGHPNIVDIFSFGELDDDRHFFVMEWLEGEDLAATIERGAMGLRRALEVLDPVCDALEAAHEAGIVHRDLKPDNVFVAQGQGGERVKLLDFGIAKLNAENDERKTPTRTGMVLGTPAYISPEQARCEPVGPKTDVYSLGVMIFEMLTGELPFVADSAMETVSLHLSEPAPPISTLWAHVPNDIDQLVMRMMAKEPDERPSLAEIRSVVRDFLVGGAAGRRIAPAGLPYEETAVRPNPGRATALTEHLEIARPGRSSALLLVLLAGFAIAGYAVWKLAPAGASQVAVPAPPSPSVSPAQTRAEARVPPDLRVGPLEQPAVAGEPTSTGAEDDSSQPAAADRTRRKRSRRRATGDSMAAPSPHQSPASASAPATSDPEPDEIERKKNSDDLDYMVDPFAD
jgi:serine/threonine-protein kinase